MADLTEDPLKSLVDLFQKGSLSVDFILEMFGIDPEVPQPSVFEDLPVQHDPVALMYAYLVSYQHDLRLYRPGTKVVLHPHPADFKHERARLTAYAPIGDGNYYVVEAWGLSPEEAPQDCLLRTLEALDTCHDFKEGPGVAKMLWRGHTLHKQWHGEDIPEDCVFPRALKTADGPEPFSGYTC